MKEQVDNYKASLIREAYEKLKETEEYQRRDKTKRLYMLALEVDLTVPILMKWLKDLGIEV